MLHFGEKDGRTSAIRRWKAEQSPLRWGSGSALDGRPFDEELKLFERQARDEAGGTSDSGPVAGHGPSGA